MDGWVTVINTLKLKLAPEEACAIKNYAETRKVLRFDRARHIMFISTRLQYMMKRRQYVHFTDAQGTEVIRGWFRIKFMRNKVMERNFRDAKVGTWRFA